MPSSSGTCASSGYACIPIGYVFDGTKWNYFTLPADTATFDHPYGASISPDGSILIAGASYDVFPTVGKPMIWQYAPPAPGPSSHKLAVIVQGIGSSLSDTSGNDGYGDTNDFGIIEKSLAFPSTYFYCPPYIYSAN